MIKLNNKNITYVALADSNNSLKAPKEIWYADSANSVKLVYRRKDALIEGEDYEKYHWLVGEIPIGASMLSLPINSSTFSYQTVLGKQQANINHFTTNGYTYFTNNNSMDIVNIYDNVNKKTVSSSSVNSRSMDIESSENGMTVNGVNIQQLGFPVKNKLITSVPNSPNATTTKTSKITVDGTKRYIPCKLLKPVPKWLDANGIRRQVGECGMIDLVSGKFYGNVNSSGTFTVENYYERKEWLQGRNGAYIDTCYKIQTYTDSINGKFRYDGSIRNPDNSQQNLFGVLNADVDIRGYVNSSNKISLFYRKFVDNNYPTTIESYDFTMEMSADVNSGVFYRYINGVNITPDLTCNGLQQTIVSDNMYLFSTNDKKWAVSNQYFHGDIAYFKITDTLSNTKMNLIPCTLTMDLPASMDANNIARTKGTSGMWDLVNDRFYGNVASSGTFKAVNLAEGVDYEVHQWLRAEVDTRASMAALPVNSTNLYFKRKRIRGLNFHYFSTNDHEYYCESPDRNFPFSIWKYSESTVVYRNTDIVSDEVIIDCSSDKIYVNGYEIPIYGYPISYVNFRAMSTSGMETLTSSVTVDGIERYIPVKLLRSIPSKYDANGRARQAGECGMYDTVNDVFYGNVASSGSFTVSDDN